MQGNSVQRLLARIKTDPEFFIMNFCITEDPHDPANPKKKFPDVPYIRSLIRDIHRNPKTIVTKSRQVMFTWTVCAYEYWDMITKPSRKNFIQSKKEDDSDRLLERIMVMDGNLSPLIKPYFPKLRKKYCRIIAEGTGSEILGIPQNPEAYRQECASVVFVDEAEFQEEMERTMTALMSTIHGGGKLIIGSSVNGNNNYVCREILNGEVSELSAK